MAGHTPLAEPGTHTPVFSRDFALSLARKALTEQQGANIHDDRAMLRAAVILEIALRQLVVSLDAENGE